jgi:hypothetical protein
MPESVRRLWLCDPEVFALNIYVHAFHGEFGEARRNRIGDDPTLRVQQQLPERQDIPCPTVSHARY